MSGVPYDTGKPMSNAHSFCTIAGNPPVWGCTLCDWRFTNEQCDHLSSVPSPGQAKSAHMKHACPADPKTE
jgi:hypothetical protein